MLDKLFNACILRVLQLIIALFQMSHNNEALCHVMHIDLILSSGLASTSSFFSVWLITCDNSSASEYVYPMLSTNLFQITLILHFSELIEHFRWCSRQRRAQCFNDYQETLDDIVPSFCDSMRQEFLKRSNANLVLEVKFQQVCLHQNLPLVSSYKWDKAG